MTINIGCYKEYDDQDRKAESAVIVQIAPIRALIQKWHNESQSPCRFEFFNAIWCGVLGLSTYNSRYAGRWIIENSWARNIAERYKKKNTKPNKPPTKPRKKSKAKRK